MADENQKSITEWCEEHYAGQDKAQRLKDLFEEATELAASLNIVGVDELVDVVKKSWEKSKNELGDASQTAGEIGDVRIATAWLASGLGIDEQAVLNDKMTVNRKKTVDQSQARFNRKKDIFNGNKPQ